MEKMLKKYYNMILNRFLGLLQSEHLDLEKQQEF